MLYNTTEQKSVSFETLFAKQINLIRKREKMSITFQEILNQTTLFSGVDSKTIEYAVSNSIISKCEKNDCLFDSNEKDPALYIIIDGKASVYGISKNQPVILNNLTSGKIFGMASLFGKKCGETTIVAKSACTYAALSQECIEHMLASDSKFTKNYISLLSQKIRFLNQKISFFTSENNEKKLIGYLLSLPYDKNNNSVTLDANMTKISQKLDIGRASLYRAFDSLEEKCLIFRQNNLVQIPSYDEFKNFYYNTNGETL